MAQNRASAAISISHVRLDVILLFRIGSTFSFPAAAAAHRRHASARLARGLGPIPPLNSAKVPIPPIARNPDEGAHIFVWRRWTGAAGAHESELRTGRRSGFDAPWPGTRRLAYP